MPKPTITPAQYRATARKVHAAYLALKAANEFSNNRIPLARTLDAIVAGFDEVRFTACKDCSSAGFVEAPDQPDWSSVCRHPKVPVFNVRTGEFNA